MVMGFPFFFFFLSILGLVVATGMIFRKIPQLRVLNVQELPEERMRKVKQTIVNRRLEQLVARRFGLILRTGSVAGKSISRVGRRVVQRVYAVEQYYEKLQKGGKENTEERVRRLLQEADDWQKAGDVFQAEKRYIEVIGLSAKCVKAYEALGKLYLSQRQYAQARETLGFAAKLDGKDASIQAHLGEIEEREGNTVEALRRFARAVELRPRNPRYLDFLIEAALALPSIEEAERGLALLESVNLENQKLPQLYERLATLKAKAGKSESLQEVTEKVS